MKAFMIPKKDVLGFFKSLEGSLAFQKRLNGGFEGKKSKGSYGQGLVRGMIIGLEQAIHLAESHLGVDYEKEHKDRKKPG